MPRHLRPGPRRSGDGSIAPLLGGFSFAIGGWTVGPLTGYLRSVTTPTNARELAEKVREVICEEWQGQGGSLYSALIYERLLEEGVEVPAYQMSAVLNAFKVGSLITASLRTQREEEEVRKHRDFLIKSVHSELCNCC